MPKQRLDLIGQTYHRLTVLEEAPSKGQSRYWRCRCACGNETIVQQGSLRSGKVKSCGCYRKEHQREVRQGKGMNIIGQTFGRLTVIAEAPSKGENRCWECRCSCGKQKIVRQSNMLTGKTKSCGCLQKEVASQIHKQELTGMTFGHLRALGELSERAKNGSIQWACACRCGNQKIVSQESLVGGHTRSCGCAQTEWRSSHAGEMRKGLEDRRIEDVVVPALMQKLSKNNTSGVKGVHPVKNKNGGPIRYQATIGLKRQIIRLGVFDTIAEAANARREAEIRYYEPYISKLAEKEKEIETNTKVGQ